MNGRGHYGNHGFNGGRTRTYVGADLVQVLTLKQRYDRVNTGAVSKLLNELAKNGTATAMGEHHWQIALRNAGWVDLRWYPHFNGLEVSITDREIHRDDEVPSVRRDYERILRGITPVLQTFGATTVGAMAHVGGGDHVYLGQGSIIPHTPTETDDELKQLHGEIMAFGQEVIELIKPIEKGSMGRVQQLRDAEMAAWKIADSFKPHVDEVYRIEKLLNAAGLSTKTTNAWREQPPPYDNIRYTPMLNSRGVPIQNAEDLKKKFIAAKEALDKFMPRAERHAAIKRARDASTERSMAQAEKMSESPLVKWSASVWRPFFDGWNSFYREKMDVPMQTWPGSGTWDRVQEYRRQFIDLRNKAPFKAQGPAPLDPSARTDPSLTGGLRNIWEGAGDVFGIVKWGVIGALGIGAVVALSSVVSNVRKGKDPSEKYLELIRETRRGGGGRSKRKLAAPREQLALASGSEDT